MDINFIVHLKTFFFLARKDSRLSTCHLSLYMALFDTWNSRRFNNPFYPSRDYLMATSKIGSKTTFAKAMDDLHQFGYIRHEKMNGKYGQSVVTILPLRDQQKGKQLLLFGEKQVSPKSTSESSRNEVEKGPDFKPAQGPDLDSQSVQKVDAEGSKNGTNRVPNLDPNTYKHINNKNWESKQAPAPIFFNKNFSPENSQNAALPACQNCAPKDLHKPTVNPELKEVIHFFVSLESFRTSGAAGKLEAAKFYNHYTAIGWKLGGINPILDWRAAARKWVLNIHEYRDRGTVPPNTYLSTDKNYSEPL